MSVIVLRAGTPDDDNREYLPETVKGSDVVVNENGNNSQPYPDRLQEHTDVVVGGETDTWYLYVPRCHDPSRSAPLVISLHGGMMTGWAQAIYTSWTLLAEREDFIVLFPNAHNRRFWLIDVPTDAVDQATAIREDGIYLNSPPEDVDENHDLRLILALIERVATEHAIDRSRIFMQGMSMGNAMTGQFARYFGDVLAGAAGSGGPTAPGLLRDADGRLLNRAGPLPVFQVRLERDVVPPHYGADVRETVAMNRDYWRSVNGVAAVPAISVRGESNLAFYEGGDAPVVFRDVKNRDHGQTFDDAEIVWSYLFSGLRRSADGAIVVGESRWPRRGDDFAIAVADGCDKVWVGQAVEDLPSCAFTWKKVKYHGLQGGTETRGTYVYVPLSFVARAFDADLETSPGLATLVFPTSQRLEFARGSVACLVDGEVVSMLAEAVERDGQLSISLEWLARDVLGLHTSQTEGVLYVTDHHAELSRNMAFLINDLLA